MTGRTMDGAKRSDFKISRRGARDEQSSPESILGMAKAGCSLLVLARGCCFPASSDKRRRSRQAAAVHFAFLQHCRLSRDRLFTRSSARPFAIGSQFWLMLKIVT